MRHRLNLRNQRSLLFAALGLVAGCHYEAYNPTEPALPTYTVRPLGLLPGGNQSQANAGSAVAVVGWAMDAGGVRHAVSFAGGQAHRLIEPGGVASSEAQSVNASGAIVGFATSSGGVREALLWSSATSTPIGLPGLGGVYTSAAGINDQNAITGAAQTDTGDTVVVIWQPSGATYGVARLDSAAGGGAVAAAINNNTQVAGSFGGGAGAFLWDPIDGFDTVSSPGSGTTVANGLSNYGIEVGSITNGSSPVQAYVYTGQIGALAMGGPPAGYANVSATAINDNGIIAGSAWTVDGVGDTLTSVAVIGTVVNPDANFTELPTAGGSVAQVSNNAMTQCGVVFGSATTTAAALPRVAVAWIPSGCSVP